MNSSRFRIFIIAAIALAAWLLAILPRAAAPGLSRRVDDFFYDAYYNTRAIESTQGSGPTADVVIVAVDQRALDMAKRAYKMGWPWRRERWGQITQYLSACGAKAVVFDLVFSEPSVFYADGDDASFGEAVNSIAAKTPVVFGSDVAGDGSFRDFAPEVKTPTLAAVNVGSDKVFRRFETNVYGRPALAVAAVRAAGAEPKLAVDRPFLLHYYGPHVDAAGKQTFKYVGAADVLGAAVPESAEEAKRRGIVPALFKGKIVIIGAITVGTYDLKSTPLATEFPGVEVQATAVANLLRGEAAHPVSNTLRMIVPLIASLLTAAGVIVPRRATVKVLAPIVVLAAVFVAGVMLFRDASITWLTPTESLFAVALSTPAAFAWTYFAEDRQRRFMLKALSKVVSPAVAEELARNPERLQLGTVRSDLTLLFTDLANFTDLSEAMDVQKLGELLNRYLGEMSDQVLKHDGTLDKYIGDAVMCFWNAPLPQADHAVRACRAALAMAAREKEISAELEAMGAKKIYTRIGINTTTAAIGFVGSAHLFNYTALGDGVNLASRLEGANKMYGTRILLSENTAAHVRDAFVLRKVDVLRVKGKREPMPVYELIAEGVAAGREKERIVAYGAALAAYQKGEFARAKQLLLEMQEAFGEDGPAQTLLWRIAKFGDAPPGGDWDGVWVAKDK